MASKRSVVLSPEALSDLEHWRMADPLILKKIVALIVDVSVNPFTGMGKPEALKHDLKGKWSRRITQEHRLVYEVTNDSIIVYACRYHYD